MRKVRSGMGRALLALFRVGARAMWAANCTNGGSETHCNSLLIVRTDGIGDFVLFTPALRHIRRVFGGYRISIIVNEPTADLASTCPYIDEVISFDIARYKWDFRYRHQTILNLQIRKFGTAIYPAYSQEPLAQELTYCAGAKETLVVDGDLNNISASLNKRNEKHFSRRLKVRGEMFSELERNRLVVEMLSAEGIEHLSFVPELWLTDSDRDSARQILAAEDAALESNLIIGLSISAAWSDKQWPTERFVEIAKKMIATYAVKVIVVGSPKEVALASAICSEIGCGSHSLAGKTRLRELAALFEMCDLIIAIDSGPLHIAAAVGTPTLAIMGGGHFGRFYPYGDLSRHRMAFQKMDCYQCNWHCVYDTARCVQEISCDAVWCEAERMMEEVVLPARRLRIEENRRFAL